MRRVIPLLAVAFVLAGCSEITPSGAAASAPAEITQVEAPLLATGSKLGLLAGKDNSEEVSVGDTSANVDKLFPSNNAVVSRQLPKGFDKDYTAENFEENGSSFGVIYYQGRVALAMRYETGLVQQDVDRTEQAYEEGLGKPTTVLSGPLVTYNFWEDPERSQRLMICYFQSPQDKTKLNLTVAVGDSKVMSQLRMNSLDAKKDSADLQPQPTGLRVPG